MNDIIALLAQLGEIAPEGAQVYNQIKYAADYKDAEIKRLEAQNEQNKMFMYASLALLILLIGLIIYKFTK